MRAKLYSVWLGVPYHLPVYDCRMSSRQLFDRVLYWLGQNPPAEELTIGKLNAWVLGTWKVIASTEVKYNPVILLDKTYLSNMDLLDELCGSIWDLED
jgi:hypothetical protein